MAVKPAFKPDLATFAGLVLAASGILGGLILEGGKVSDVSQVTALMIVMGGTLGAVLITTPLAVAIRAAKKFKWVFFEEVYRPAQVIDTLIGYAAKARKNSIVSLENDVASIEDPFMQKALMLAVDGTDLQELRKMMEIDMILEEKGAEECAKVYEAAGGYSPTIGIIGAVLGLIQVMKHLENIEEVGHGIAVAFVATVYGVAAANLLFIPAANKIKARAQQTLELRELALEGVCSIVEGLNPKLIQLKLQGYVRDAVPMIAGPEERPRREAATASAARG